MLFLRAALPIRGERPPQALRWPVFCALRCWLGAARWPHPPSSPRPSREPARGKPMTPPAPKTRPGIWQTSLSPHQRQPRRQRSAPGPSPQACPARFWKRRFPSPPFQPTPCASNPPPRCRTRCAMCRACRPIPASTDRTPSSSASAALSPTAAPAPTACCATECGCPTTRMCRRSSKVSMCCAARARRSACAASRAGRSTSSPNNPSCAISAACCSAREGRTRVKPRWT